MVRGRVKECIPMWTNFCEKAFKIYVLRRYWVTFVFPVRSAANLTNGEERKTARFITIDATRRTPR